MSQSSLRRAALLHDAPRRVVQQSRLNAVPNATGIAVEYLKPHDAARYLGISVTTLKHWRRFRVGPPYVRIGNLVRYETSSVLSFAAGRNRRKDVDA